MATPFFNANVAARIKAMNLRAFMTAKSVGLGLDLVLYRGQNEETGEPVPLPAQNVLVEFADREVTQEGSPATKFAGVDGTLEKESPFDVQGDDRFRLPGGATGVVKMVMPEEDGVITAPFTLET